ncbi:MAG: hypothetical protein ABIG11_10855 [bacterium]
MYKKMLVFSALILLVFPPVFSQDDSLIQNADPKPPPAKQGHAIKAPVPTYLSINPDLNEYYLYADGGWDGHWYVGYNSCWIVKLPPAAPGNYSRTFMGAKLGRAKTTSVAGNAWEKAPLPGKIYMSLSQSPSFSSEQNYFLTEAADIPFEPSPNDNVRGTGPSEWFWAEVPLSQVSSEKPNYLAIWSSSEYFTSSSSSPIIAGAETQARQETVWLNRSVRGVPPRDAENALEIPVFYLQPALAIKMIPPNEYKVLLKGFMASISASNVVTSFSAIGQDIRGAWMEISHDKFDWQRISRVLARPPYSFTFDRTQLPSDLYYLRAAAVDSLENTGYSREITVQQQAVQQ